MCLALPNMLNIPQQLAFVLTMYEHQNSYSFAMYTSVDQ